MILFLPILIALVQSVSLEELQTELSIACQNIEDAPIIVTNILKKTQDMAKESRQISSKSNKIISKLQKSTDVNIYSVFNADIFRKFELAESQYKSIDKNLKDGTVTKRIENVIEFYVKRQKVPDPEMHQHLLQVERKIGEVAHLIKNAYNIDWLCITLIGLALVVVYVWKLAKKAEKKHYL